jgi:hypothetical protein
MKIEKGTQITGHQIKPIRLKFRWLREVPAAQNDDQNSITKQLVLQVINTGPVRTWGYRWIVTYPRQ